MYSTCLFCHSALGANELIEHFPLGRRLAFDPAKGRLWVVCLKCVQWNLTPLEERWEAIEEGERQFRSTRVRASTGEIGIARMREGLDLIRIGAPLRPEFCGWRYGEQFRRRRRRAIATGVVASAATAVAAPFALPVMLPALTVLFPYVWGFGPWIASYIKSHRIVARVPIEGATPLTVRAGHLPHLRLEPTDSAGGFGIEVFHDLGATRLAGTPALHAASVLFARTNRHGASPTQVRRAVDRIDRAGDATQFLAAVSRTSRPLSGRRIMAGYRQLSTFNLAPHERFAVEMALHEESERAALDRELAELEAAWREAEEIAAIADNMFLPPAVAEFMRQHRQRPIE